MWFLSYQIFCYLTLAYFILSYIFLPYFILSYRSNLSYLSHLSNPCNISKLYTVSDPILSDPILPYLLYPIYPLFSLYPAYPIYLEASLSNVYPICPILTTHIYIYIDILCNINPVFFYLSSLSMYVM